MSIQLSKIAIADDIKDLLLFSKARQPLTETQKKDLEEISRYDVSNYSEADVRAEIIDPILRILGYSKSSYFSIYREKHLKIANNNLYIDYQMTLWSHAFWIIEAKKVKRKRLGFTAEELKQALVYAAHPEIDAALIVLCDGRILEIYAREVSVSQPAVRINIKQLPEQFYQIQALLGPWQSWFFQKRRALNLIHRILRYEMIPRRIDELSQALNRIFEKTRTQAYKNWQQLHSDDQENKLWLDSLEKSSIKDIVSTEFFDNASDFRLSSTARILASKARHGTFELIYEILPEEPRHINDNYIAHSLRTLIELDILGCQISSVPNWARSQFSKYHLCAEDVIKEVISHCLNTFDNVPELKCILQFSAHARRMSKIFMAVLPDVTMIGEIKHQLIRFQVDELANNQFFSTPLGCNVRQLDISSYFLTEKYVRECYEGEMTYRKFNVDKALMLLKQSWLSERILLKDGKEYWNGVHGLNLDAEIYPTEHSWVTFDSLGHIVLCILRNFPKWREYVASKHLNEIIRIASLGSWAAKEILQDKNINLFPKIDDKQIAKRFFNGDTCLFAQLRNAYNQS